MGEVLNFPKSARLLKKRDFTFRPFKRCHTEHFKLIYSDRGTGRLGISISKKVLKSAVARNRVRRLLKESFRIRRSELTRWDVHVIGLPALSVAWEDLTLSEVDLTWSSFRRSAQ